MDPGALFFAAREETASGGGAADRRGVRIELRERGTARSQAFTIEISLDRPADYLLPPLTGVEPTLVDEVRVLKAGGEVLVRGGIGQLLRSADGRTGVLVERIGGDFVLRVTSIRKRVRWQVAAGASEFRLDPNLPRGLRVHENHPDDRSFLSGNAGSTDLEEVTLTLLNTSIELDLDLGESGGSELRLVYNLKVPLTEEGRREKQQENDPRPPREGSFIFTQVERMEPAHEIGAGFGQTAGERVQVWLSPMLFLGYWQISFSRGWDRFGSDETTLTGDARGFSLFPEIELGLGTTRLRGSVTVGYRSLDLEYEPRSLGNARADGWELGVALRVQL